MANHVQDTVFERRLRPIYDSLEVGNNKKALQEAEKLLKKQPSLICAQALKALALLRLGKYEESNTLLKSISREKPTDDSTLQVLSFCFKEMGQLDKICDLYNHAAKQSPGNEEILAHLFISHVRLDDYKAQQSVALQLYRVKLINAYYFWAVISVVLQGIRGPESKNLHKRKLYLALAQRMVEKMIAENKLEAEQEALLYVTILDEQGKYKEALDFLNGPVCKKCYPGAPVYLKIDLLKKIQMWDEINIMLKELLKDEFLATGVAFRQLAFSFRISKSTVATIVIEVCLVVWKTLKEKHMKFPSAEELKFIAEEYQKKGKFPHCCGCIDGKHIRLKKPEHSGSMYFNYKHFYSVVLMSVCDSNYRFRIIDVGAYGKDSDGGVLNSSKFFQEIIHGNCKLPGEEPLPNSNIVASYVFLGDEAFPLTNFIMRPYPRRHLQGDNSKSLFNRKLSSTRAAVECTFGIAATKFRILLKAIETSVENAISIVQAICLLQNVIIDREGLVKLENSLKDMRKVTMRNIAPSRENNRPTRSALNAREATYFVEKNVLA